VHPAELVVEAVKEPPLATDAGEAVMHAAPAVPLIAVIVKAPEEPASCGWNCTDWPEVNETGLLTTVLVFGTYNTGVSLEAWGVLPPPPQAENAKTAMTQIT